MHACTYTRDHIWKVREGVSRQRGRGTDLCVANGEENLSQQDEGTGGESVQIPLVGQQQSLTQVTPEHTNTHVR